MLYIKFSLKVCFTSYSYYYINACLFLSNRRAYVEFHSKGDKERVLQNRKKLSLDGRVLNFEVAGTIGSRGYGRGDAKRGGRRDHNPRRCNSANKLIN